jgi:hypothetical protein
LSFFPALAAALALISNPLNRRFVIGRACGVDESNVMER